MRTRGFASNASNDLNLFVLYDADNQASADYSDGSHSEQWQTENTTEDENHGQ